MSTIPHQNPENGYAIRISKNLPKDAANLSYVHVDKPTPSKNINLKDFTGNIQENKKQVKEELVIGHVNDIGLLEVDQKVYESKTPNLIITNEYANNLDNTPLFYKYRSKYLFDTNNIQVMVPITGNRLSAPKFLHDYKEGEYSQFVYEGEKVIITRTENTLLKREDSFKVTIEREGSGYYLVVYSARELMDSGYEIHYPAIINGKTKNVKEIMNLNKVYTQNLQVDREPSKDNFRVIANENNTFSVKVNSSGQNFLIDETNREPYTFDYQLKAKIKTRLGQKNPLNINIGVIYLNEHIFNATNTMPSLKKIVEGNNYMPDYLTFDNPHPRSEGITSRTNSEYWEASINMPLEHWLDYDILIISGYGEYDISRANQSIREYLELGGTIIIESAGELDDSLELKNNQIADIHYSKTQTRESIREISFSTLSDRYFDIRSMSQIGSISPVLEFKGRENENDWDVFVSHENGGESLIRKRINDSGQVIYSNLGLMKSILFNNTMTYRFFTNLILVLLEERVFVTPIQKEFLYHKDDLYKEEYLDELDMPLYVDDRSDEDTTQVVAKKIIDPNVMDKVQKYLPSAYKVWENIEIKTVLYDSKDINIINNQFRLAGDKEFFEETTPDAFPGFRYIAYSGNQGTGYHDSTIGEIEIETINTQAFFEQELGRLTPGQYQLKVHAKVDSSKGAGFALYDIKGEPVAVEEIEGTKDWSYYNLDFNLEEAERLYLRLGTYGGPGDARITFSEVSLKSNGVIRMSSNKEGPLYAYAINAKGKNNQLVAYEQTYNNPDILKESIELHGLLRVRSFTYRWHSESAQYKKQFGNEKIIPLNMNSQNKDIVLGNIFEYLPALESGVEWSRKQNVYYSFELEGNEFLGISIYDPTIDKFFFTPSGKWVINHNDIWWNGYESTIQLRLHTNFYHLIATNSQFTVKQEDNREIRVFMPYTEDERDRWHVRIQNGQFSKNSINAGELKDLEELNKETHYDEYLIGEHIYSIPEYSRQTFYPNHGERLINDEQAVYVNSNKIEVQSTPMIIKEFEINKEQLEPSNDRKRWVSENILWDTNKLPDIYLDQNNTNELIILTKGFKINYREGSVSFEEPVEGTIYASYSHDNFKIFRRNFDHKHISGELLTTRDGHSFQLEKEKITVMPAPKFYLGRISEDSLIHPSRYWIDYENGRVQFFTYTPQRIYANYNYFTEEELTYSDVNKNTGEIFLEERISFKDNIYVTYLTKEDTYEYKGYYNEEHNKFIQLDLNPTSGHQFSYINNEKIETLEGRELLDKEIYIYLLPYRSVYYKKVVTNPISVRHVFHKEEWMRVKEAHPEAVLLAQIQVRENTNKENIVMMDARRLGGGLKETITDKEVKERIGYTSAFWDIGNFDGLAYYKNGVLVVEVPEKVLRSKGGSFTEDEIRGILNKYMAYGVHPIIEYTKEEQDDR